MGIKYLLNNFQLLWGKRSRNVPTGTIQSLSIHLLAPII